MCWNSESDSEIGKLIPVSERAIEEGIPDTLNATALKLIQELDGVSARGIQNRFMDHYGVDQGVATYWACLSIADLVKTGVASISSGGVIRLGKLEIAVVPNAGQSVEVRIPSPIKHGSSYYDEKPE
jgi:hypothetical protein